jgi:nitric oxide reductase NorQ protein
VIPGVKAESSADAGDAAGSSAVLRTAPAPLELEPGTVLRRPNGETYLPREIVGNHDVATLRALARAELYVLLAGEPGSGKTALVEAAFPELVSVQCHGDMTVAHLLGSHLPSESGGWVWADGPLTVAARTGVPLYLDEVNLMPMDVSGVLHSAMDGRGMIRLDDRPDAPVVAAQPGFYVVGAYNPTSLGGRRLSEALLSRFTVQIEVTTDYDAARSLGVPEELVTIAENLVVKSRTDRRDGGRGVWAPQMRELLSAMRLVDAGLGLEFAAAALASQCPWPEDLDVVLAVVGHVLGTPVAPLHLGQQAW